MVRNSMTELLPPLSEKDIIFGSSKGFANKRHRGRRDDRTARNSTPEVEKLKAEILQQINQKLANATSLRKRFINKVERQEVKIEELVTRMNILLNELTIKKSSLQRLTAKIRRQKDAEVSAMKGREMQLKELQDLIKNATLENEGNVQAMKGQVESYLSSMDIDIDSNEDCGSLEAKINLLNVQDNCNNLLDEADKILDESSTQEPQRSSALSEYFSLKSELESQRSSTITCVQTDEEDEEPEQEPDIWTLPSPPVAISVCCNVRGYSLKHGVVRKGNHQGMDLPEPSVILLTQGNSSDMSLLNAKGEYQGRICLKLGGHSHKIRASAVWDEQPALLLTDDVNRCVHFAELTGHQVRRSSPGLFDSPCGLTVHRETVVVADEFEDKVVILSLPSLVPISSIQLPKFSFPVWPSINAGSQELWIACGFANKILIKSLDDENTMSEIMHKGKPISMNLPTGLVHSPDGKCTFFTDEHRLVRVNSETHEPTGSKGRLCKPGKSTEEFNQPGTLCVLPGEDKLLICDSGNYRVIGFALSEL